MAQALDPGGGAAGANVALRVLDAVDLLVEVSAVASVDTVLSKIARGEDPTFAELHAVFGPGGPHETKAVEAPAMRDTILPSGEKSTATRTSGLPLGSLS